MFCFINLTPQTPPSVIHGWKATDLLYEMVKTKKIFFHPVKRQIFDDAPKQTFYMISKLVLAGGITQVLDALPWVRCASGNVLLSHRFFLHFPISCFFLFLYPLISRNLNFICHGGWFELWTQYPGSVVPLAMFFTKLEKWYFLFSYRRISGHQNCISFYPQNSYNFALTIS